MYRQGEIRNKESRQIKNSKEINSNKPKGEDKEEPHRSPSRS